MTTSEKLERKISKITDAYQSLTDKLMAEVEELLDTIETLEADKADLQSEIESLDAYIAEIEADEETAVAA